MLADSFGRRIEYLRLSVTDRCNYLCSYCRTRDCGNETGGRGALLDDTELARLVRLFAELGVRKVRLTGGEPLVRRDLPRLAQAISVLPGIADLSLSTNGHLLERDAQALRDAGVRRINLSLDSLDPVVFERITGGGNLARVLRGIDAARAAGLDPIKINTVVLDGINDSEIERLADFAWRQGLVIRYIEVMPVGAAGRESMQHYFPAARILNRLAAHFGDSLIPVAPTTGAGPARCYRTADGRLGLGVISAMSQHFCKSCNRVRLTAQGELVLCLGRQHMVDLRKPMRAGASDEEIREIIRQAIQRKPERHDFQHPGQEVFPMRAMSALGG